MVRSLMAFLIVAIFLPAVVSAQTVQYTKRAKSEIREGPGNYFPLLYVFPPGVPVVLLKNKDGWVNVRCGEAPSTMKSEIAGWMSKNCLVDAKPPRALKNLDLIIDSPNASASGVAAAIRGFALRYGRTGVAAVDSLLRYYGRLFSPQEYEEFKRRSPAFTRGSEGMTLFERSGSFLGEYDISMDEEGIGLGVASRVAGQGLIDDRALLKYINLLVTFLSEASGAYDYPFTVLVIRGTQVNAIAIPGGFIFVTQPMLSLCRDEAELAGVIAHEMTHIILKHGVKEIGERIVNIKMDQAMRELDEETGEQPDTTEQDLEDYALAAFESASKPRLQSYEEAADSGAVLILARAGYDPSAVPRMVLRIRDAVKQNEQIQEENPFAHLDFQNRYDHLMRFMKESGLSEIQGATNAQRFFKELKR